MASEKACKKCRRIVEGTICPVCQEANLTRSFEGYIVVLSPDNSDVAKEIGATTPGKYALKIK